MKNLILFLTLLLSTSAFGQGPVIWQSGFARDLSTSGLKSKKLSFLDSTTNLLTMQANSSTTSYTVTWPATQGGSSTTISNNGSGVLTWVALPVDAAAATTGVVNTSAQSFGGLKKLEGGFASSEYVGTNPEVGGSTPFQLTNAHHRIQIINPAGAITVKLPTTTILAGEKWTIVNRSTNKVTIQSSGANQLAIIENGSFDAVVVTATPTAAADWRVVYLTSSGTYVPTYVATANVTGTPTGTLNYKRTNNLTTLYGSVSVNPTLAALTQTIFTLSLPDTVRSSNFGNSDLAVGVFGRFNSNKGLSIAESGAKLLDVYFSSETTTNQTHWINCMIESD